MIRLGITGTVAAGKSRVAEHLRQRGATIVDCDALGHEVRRRADVAAAVRKAFGADDRATLAKLVFNDPAARDRLEKLLHPPMRAAAAAELAAAVTPVAGLDAAILFEAGWADLVEVTLCVDADPALRLARAAARGWDAAEFARREAAQWPAARKRAAADFTLVNDDWETCRRALDTLAAPWFPA